MRNKPKYKASVSLGVEHQRQLWVDTLGKVNSRLVALRQQKYNYQQLAHVADNNEQLKGFYILDISRWFAAFAAMAIRRECDDAADCHSLLLVLTELAKARPPVLDCLNNPVDLSELRRDRKQLIESSRKIHHIADKEIAHATISGAQNHQRPTYEELYDCIDFFESTSIKYRTLLSGQSVLLRKREFQTVLISM